MLAAIYARKSTDQSGVSDDEKSVTRQIEHARAYAERKGWTVVEEHIYVDDGISGAEFVKRPGLARLLNALKPKAPFQVLIISEPSRIGRDQENTLPALCQIVRAGVEIWSYLDGKQWKLDTATDKFMANVANFASELEREKASQRTADAMLRKAKAGHVTGGKVYGYVNVRTDGHVTRVVHEPEAAVIRRIFQMYADGTGMVGIAHQLNAEGVKPPRGRGWAPSGIREMLHRPLYRGEITWGKSQKIVSGGTKTQRKRDASEWITLPSPESRIISEELALRVDARLQRAAGLYARSAKGELLSRPRRRDESAYLLTGFATCATCGGPVGADTHRHGTGESRKDVPFYCCLDSKRRGLSVCSNRVTIRQDILDRAILDEIDRTLDNDDLSRAVGLALEELTAGAEAHRSRKADVSRELAGVQARIDRLLDALSDGSLPADEIKKRLNAEKTRKDSLTTECDRLDGMLRVADVDASALKADALLEVNDLRNALAGDIPVARQILRKLLGGEKIKLAPVGEGRERGYRFEGKLALGGLLIGGSAGNPASTEARTKVVAPTGFEPVFQP